jgi:hypothetical protein
MGMTGRAGIGEQPDVFRDALERTQKPAVDVAEQLGARH